MKDRKFYQAKYEYYRTMNMWIIVAVCIFSTTYFWSDCYIFGELRTTTLLARTFILVPMCLYLLANRMTQNYQIMIPLSYVAAHSVMWCTIWACVYLPDLSYAFVGFIIIHFIFLAAGVAAPVGWALVAHALLFVDIMIANTFLHYPDYGMMFLLGVPLYLGISCFVISLEKVYRDQYVIRQQLEESAKHDRLTGAYNRNIMTELADENRVLLRGENAQTGIMLYDLDHFKQINDTYGHAAGDEVLMRVSEVVMAALHDGEYLIRWGGEEFVLILQGTMDDLYRRAEDMRLRVAQLELSVGKVSISGGLAPYRGGDYSKTVRQADDAMYQAKNNGRNQIAVYRE